MDRRDPKTGRHDARPPFGLGPIARVSSSAGARAAMSAPAAQATVATGRAGGLAPVGRRTVVGFPVGPALAGAARGFGAPFLRRNVCPHFYVTGPRGAIPINAPHLLKGLVRQDRTISRCQLRGGVHLEAGYVNDVCLSPRFNQCVFYEEDLTGR